MRGPVLALAMERHPGDCNRRRTRCSTDVGGQRQEGIVANCRFRRPNIGKGPFNQDEIRSSAESSEEAADSN